MKLKELIKVLKKIDEEELYENSIEVNVSVINNDGTEWGWEGVKNKEDLQEWINTIVRDSTKISFWLDKKNKSPKCNVRVLPKNVLAIY